MNNTKNILYSLPQELINYIYSFNVDHRITLKDSLNQIKIILACYDTATQSGIPGIAATYGMLSVTTPCEGFLEQAEYNDRIILSADFKPSSFAWTMLDAKRKRHPNLVNEELKITSGFVKKCLQG